MIFFLYHSHFSLCTIQDNYVFILFCMPCTLDWREQSIPVILFDKEWRKSVLVTSYMTKTSCLKNMPYEGMKSWSFKEIICVSSVIFLSCWMTVIRLTRQSKDINRSLYFRHLLMRDEGCSSWICISLLE